MLLGVFASHFFHDVSISHKVALEATERKRYSIH